MKDSYGETTIQSLYYDTDDYRLVRTSIEHPVFKEKRSLRCHNLNLDDSGIYIEMKRKNDGVVYKRRIPCKERESETILRNPDEASQIQKEPYCFNRYYHTLCPKTMILYDRQAFLDSSSDIRIIFEESDVTIISISGGNSSIDTENGYSYQSGSVLALSSYSGMSNESMNCRNFSFITSKVSMNLKKIRLYRFQSIIRKRLPLSSISVQLVSPSERFDGRHSGLENQQRK